MVNPPHRLRIRPNPLWNSWNCHCDYSTRSRQWPPLSKNAFLLENVRLNVTHGRRGRPTVDHRRPSGLIYRRHGRVLVLRTEGPSWHDSLHVAPCFSLYRTIETRWLPNRVEGSRELTWESIRGNILSRSPSINIIPAKLEHKWLAAQSCRVACDNTESTIWTPQWLDESDQLGRDLQSYGSWTLSSASPTALKGDWARLSPSRG